VQSFQAPLQVRLKHKMKSKGSAYTVLWVCMARFWSWGGYRGGFCEKL